MTGRLKITSFALAAMCAVSAIAAASAFAESTFHLEAEATQIVGAQVSLQVFATETAEYECEVIQLQGSVTSSTTKELELHPIYEDCSLFGLEIEVDTEGCTYVLDAEGSVQIACEAGKKIEMTVAPGLEESGKPICSMSIPEQTVGHAGFASQGSGSSRDVLMTLTTSEVTYESEGGKWVGICGGKGHHEDLQQIGVITLKGFDGELNQAGLWWE